MKRVTEIEMEAMDARSEYSDEYGQLQGIVSPESIIFNDYAGRYGVPVKCPRPRGGQVRNFWYKGKCVRSPAVCELLVQYGDLEFGDEHETEPLRWALSVYHTAGRMHFKQVHKGS